MYLTLFIVTLTCVWFCPCSADFDYCKLNCGQYKHTMCLYEGVSDQCLNHKQADIDDKTKNIIVDKHNEMRRAIAKGEKYKASYPALPKAANMMKFQWHEESARVAQRWADQCKFAHDKCRKLQDMDNGQNMAETESSGRISEVPYVYFLESFYDEITRFNVSYVGKFVFVHNTGHFTQQIWAKTEYVGCGASFYQSNEAPGQYFVNLVCNYGPRGNMKDQPIYKTGDPCSACPQGTTCEDGLCVGNIKDQPIKKTGEPCSACPQGTTCEDGLCVDPKKSPPAPGGTQKMVPQMLSVFMAPILYYCILKFIYSV